MKLIEKSDLLLVNDKNIKKIVDDLNDDLLVNSNIDCLAKEIAFNNKINHLGFGDKKYIETQIVDRNVKKYRVPNGLRYDTDEDYIVMELGYYKIKYFGDSKLIKFLFHNNILDIKFYRDSLNIEISIFDDLRNNNDNKQKVSNLFLEIYKSLEESFEEIKENVITYNSNLEVKIASLLQGKKDLINRRNENNNDLNPFLN